ncbi:MAG: hypothetical protein SXV54_24205 [Chloroflexota bacterium]|nr:hypothetical protein [Chloroflexota bacterium]
MNSTNSTNSATEPVVGTLRVADGLGVKDVAPYATTLSPPPHAARSREGERLFILLDLVGPVSPHLYRELREVVTQTYWAATGSITAALRQAAAAANRHLFQVNLHADPSDRYDGGLSCAVLRDEDLFILRAGPAHACFLHEGYLECFSRGEALSPLGTGQLADARLHHTFTAPGDKLLLASSPLIQGAGAAGISRVLALAGVQDVLEGLEQVGAGVDFTALVVRWPLPGEAPADSEVSPPTPGLIQELPPSRPSRKTIAKPGPAHPRQREESLVEAEHEYPLPSHEPPHSKPDRRPGPSLTDRVGSVWRGITAAGAGLIGGISTLFRRMLPGAERGTRHHGRTRPARSRVSRPVPQENRAVMMAIAIGIPIVLAIVVTLAYRSFGESSRFHNVVDQAEKEVALAQAAGSIPEQSRPHWKAALEHANAATALRPEDQVATALQAQAEAALDLLDGIVRLQPIQLKNLGLGTVPRQIVVHGQMIFVLDPAGGWVARLTLNQTGDGVVEQEDIPTLIKKGERIGEGIVGDMVDFIWVSMGGGRQTSGLLILEEDGALISYDPAWEGEGGTPQLKRSFLGVPPAAPLVVDTYDGRFYILDTAINQIRRYEPQGDTYPERPDHYFVVSPPRSLTEARDMAIDGYIYVLYDDGAILKFLRGEPEPFDVSGLPGDLSQAVALAVDPNGSSGVVYVADQGSGRVVALGPDGGFRAQFRADEAFDALETLAVDEAARRMYVISGGRLYVASLP